LGIVFVLHYVVFLVCKNVVGDTKTIGALAKEWHTKTKILSVKQNEKLVLATAYVISEMRQAKT
jgi:hypothetical protein